MNLVFVFSGICFLSALFYLFGQRSYPHYVHIHIMAAVVSLLSSYSNLIVKLRLELRARFSLASFPFTQDVQ